MGMLDLFKRRPKPAAAVQQRPQQRHYKAAKTDRLTWSWTKLPLSADAVVRQYQRPLRARSREQYANNDYARRFVGMVQANVVGPTGIGMQARAISRRGNPDNSANDGIEAAWKQWGRRETCDISQRLGWREMQRLFIATVAIDGEAFLIQHTRKANRYNYALQLVDPELCPVDYDHEPDNIRMGIEYDADDRPVAYHFQTLTQDGSYARNGQRYIRYPAEQVIHAYLPEYVGQRRGLPWMATALLRMNQLAGYEDAAIVAARVGAAKMGFFTSPDGTAYSGDDTDSQGHIITDAEAGTFEQLPDGVQLQTFDPQYPHGEYADFVKTCLRGIASGLGVSYHGLSNDLEGVNFSSIRSGVLEEREIWKGLQEWCVDNLHSVIYENWLPRALLANAISTPSGGTLAIAQEEKYRRVTWQPRRWPWVDPLKDMQANQTAINERLRSRSDVIREMGRDPEEVWREIQRETELLESMGLKPEQPPEPKPADEAGFSSGEPEDDDQDDQD